MCHTRKNIRFKCLFIHLQFPKIWDTFSKFWQRSLKAKCLIISVLLDYSIYGKRYKPKPKPKPPNIISPDAYINNFQNS